MKSSPHLFGALAWLAALVALRLLLSVWIWNQWSDLLPRGSSLALPAGDTESYLAPADLWFETGIWGERPHPEAQPEPRAGRMPGYGLLYAFWRLFFEPETARTALMVVQWVLGVGVAWVLGGWVARLVGEPVVRGPVALLIGTACWFVQYDLLLLTESPSVGVLGFAAGVAWRRLRPDTLLLLGLLLAAGVFLRPLLGWFWLGTGVALAIGLRHLDWRTWAARLAIFALPLVVFEGVWLARNYAALGRWVPLQTNIYADYAYSPVRLALFDFVSSWGGDIVWWDPRSEIRLFLPDNVGGIASHPDNTFDRLPEALVRALGRPSLERLAASTRAAEAMPRDSAFEAWSVWQAAVANQVRAALKTYQQREGWDWHVGARLRLLRRYLVRSGTEDLLNRPANRLPLWELLLKVYYSGLYWSMMTLGWVGLGWWAWRRRDGRLQALLIVLVGYLLLIPWGFRYCEWRYQAPLYPFLLAGVGLAGVAGWQWVQRRRQIRR